VVTFDPHSIEQAPLASAVKAHVSGLPVQVVVEPVERARSLAQQLASSGSLARSRGALGTFSIEFGAKGELLIFFTEPDGDATLIRRLPPNPEGARVAIEQAAIVVRSLVEALLEGRRIGMSQEVDSSRAERAAPREPVARRRARAAQRPRNVANPEPDTSEQTESEPEIPSFDFEEAAAESERPARGQQRFAVSGGYTGTDFASNTEWQSGFALGLRWLASPVLYGSVRYAFFPNLEGGGDTALVSIARRPIELAGGYLGKSLLAPSAEFGVIADYSSRETLHTAPGYRPSPSVARWTLALGARAGATWSATSILQLTLRGGVDVLLTRYTYAVPGDQAAVTPNTIRPRLDLEVALGVW
jgi:hypothetical protein